MPTSLQEVPAFLGFFVAVAGAVVSGRSLGRSRWATFLLAGFSAEATAFAFSRVALFAMRNGLVAPSSLGLAFGAAALLGLVGRSSVVAGVAGVLAELRTASGASEGRT